MTTIVASRLGMAADRLATDDAVRTSITKIKLVKGCLIGYAGDAQQGAQFIHWFADKRRKEPDLSDTDVLVLTPAKELLLFMQEYDSVPLKVEGDFYSIGSGAAAALGALHALGYSEKLDEYMLRRAIHIASLVDPATGNGDDYLELPEKPDGKAARRNKD